MEVNWWILGIVAVAVIILVIYIIWKNFKDKKDLEISLNEEIKPETHETEDEEI